MPHRNRFWSYTPEERKEEIVTALEAYLRQHPEHLTDRQKLLLRDAISHAYRGMFGMANEDVYDLARPESEWASPVAPAMVDGISRENLTRALEVLKHAPAQTLPVFR